MEKLGFEKYDGSQVTESMLQEASQLCSEHLHILEASLRRLLSWLPNLLSKKLNLAVGSSTRSRPRSTSRPQALSSVWSIPGSS